MKFLRIFRVNACMTQSFRYICRYEISGMGNIAAHAVGALCCDRFFRAILSQSKYPMHATIKRIIVNSASIGNDL